MEVSVIAHMTMVGLEMVVLALQLAIQAIRSVVLQVARRELCHQDQPAVQVAVSFKCQTMLLPILAQRAH